VEPKLQGDDALREVRQKTIAIDPSKRPLPSSREAEVALLGSVLLDNEALSLSLGIISKEDFCFEANRVIFGKMVSLAEVGRTIDAVTILDALESDGLLEKVGGAPYLSDLTDGVPIGTTANIPEYCRIIKEKSDVRHLINAANGLLGKCFEGVDSPAVLVEQVQEEILKIGSNGNGTGFQTIGEIVAQSFGTLDVMFDKGKAVTGIETGLVDLDSMTSGFQPTDLIIIAGRPSTGKTALALGIGSYAAVTRGKKVGIFSLEMSKPALVTRFLCSEGRVDHHKLHTGFSSREDWERMVTALGRISCAPLYIDDSSALTIPQIRSKARRLKSEHGLDLLIVDYLQLIAGHGKFENRTQEVTYISRSLKAIAKELKVPVVALSQLSRRPEQRTNQKPELSDLRESGSIEQDADIVIFIFRSKRKRGQDDEEPRSGYEVSLIIGKQRNGPTGEVPVIFLKPYAKFENVAPEYERGAEPYESE